jgi:hypothetical protein
MDYFNHHENCAYAGVISKCFFLHTHFLKISYYATGSVHTFVALIAGNFCESRKIYLRQKLFLIRNIIDFYSSEKT